MGKSFDITWYWNLSSKVISLSNCSKARRLRMFVIYFFANLFWRLFNPFNSICKYFPSTSSLLSSFSSFINISVNFLTISVFEEGASVIFSRLFEALLFFTHFSFPVTWEITDNGFSAVTFPDSDPSDAGEELLFWTSTSSKIIGSILVMLCSNGWIVWDNESSR